MLRQQLRDLFVAVIRCNLEGGPTVFVLEMRIRAELQ